MKYEPFKTSGIDALAQCPRCLRTWTYDALDAWMDHGRKQMVDGYVDDLHCRNCGVKARLFQSLENIYAAAKARQKK